MDTLVLHYLLLATALLGSPGPGILSLLAVGRLEGMRQGLHYYGGLQFGLALGAAMSALGLISMLQLLPWLFVTLTFAAIGYLAYLGWRIATAPVGIAGAPLSNRSAFTAKAGLVFGFANPKALPAFAALFASTQLIAGNAVMDMLAKWLLCVLVMIVVDLAWLMAGVALGKASMHPLAERAFNLACGATLIVAAASLFPALSDQMNL